MGEVVQGVKRIVSRHPPAILAHCCVFLKPTLIAIWCCVAHGRGSNSAPLGPQVLNFTRLCTFLSSFLSLCCAKCAYRPSYWFIWSEIRLLLLYILPGSRAKHLFIPWQYMLLPPWPCSSITHIAMRKWETYGYRQRWALVRNLWLQAEVGASEKLMATGRGGRLKRESINA